MSSEIIIVIRIEQIYIVYSSHVTQLLSNIINAKKYYYEGMSALIQL